MDDVSSFKTPHPNKTKEVQPTIRRHVIMLNPEQDEVYPKTSSEPATEEKSSSEPPLKRQKVSRSATTRRKILQIKDYKHHFSKTRLKDFNWPDDWENLSEEELEGLLAEIKYVVAIGNVQTSNNLISKVGLSVIEGGVCTFTPIRAQGLTETLITDEEFNDIMNEFLLENADYLPKTCAERLSWKIVVTILALHQQNKQNEGNIIAPKDPNVILQKEVPAYLEERYGDL